MPSREIIHVNHMDNPSTFVLSAAKIPARLSLTLFAGMTERIG
jgi:hypothetical protein